jgi:hypothetical protein
VTYYDPGYVYAPAPTVVVAPGAYYYRGHYYRRHWR